MKAVLLVSHGSRSHQTKREVQALVSELRKTSDVPLLEMAFLEIESPSIDEGIDRCVAQGASQILILLNFLNAGRHVDVDIPAIVYESQLKHPKVSIQISEPVGQHPGVKNLFQDLIEHNPRFIKPQHKDFSRKLLRWYRQEKRDLPWRQYHDPYAIWVSEIMLQQTTVATVIPYFQKWMSKYPDVYALAEASEQALMKDWQGLGYYNRVKNMRKAARVIVDEYDGQFPTDPGLLKKLPGLGDYTVAAVLSIAFNQPLPLVDTNVRRVVMRQMAMRGRGDSKVDLTAIHDFLTKAFPTKSAGDFNQALMELGALVCRSKEPLCNQCPVRQECKAFLGGVQEIIPEPKKKIVKEVDAVIAVIENKGKYYIQQRPDQGLLAGMWEFPGGKIEQGEKPSEALRREIKEELRCDVINPQFLFKVKHFYTTFKVNLSVWSVQLTQKPMLDNKHKWVRFQDFEHYPMPSGSAKIVERLKH